MKKPDLNLQSLILAARHFVSRYAVILFLLLLVAVYGFVLYRVGSLSSGQLNDADVTSQVKATAVPHIDPMALQQIQNLQDNSVSVQTLFNEARSNPFQE